MPHSSKGLGVLLKNPFDFYLDYRTGHHNSTVNPSMEVDDFLHQNILAAMAGDGCLIKNTEKGTHRLSWNIGNKEHALSKVERFAKLNPRYREKKNPGFGDNWFCVSTSCTKVLDSYADKYGNSKDGYDIGKICRELDPVGWAAYFGDDGHCTVSSGKRVVEIHTESFSRSEVQSVVDALIAFIANDGVKVRSYIGGKKKRELYSVSITTRSAQDEFFKRISKHMENGVEYKIKQN
ncbi:TPA: hypothetical protein LUL88_004429 [Escherichia coli]|nr:hypothetical protein [Escherichia coli]